MGWKEALERTFAFTSHYLIARRSGEIVGVLPLCELHAPFMDRCLLSLPFAVEAGVCGADDEARRALDAAALELARSRGARYMELRDGRDVPGFRIRAGLYYRFRQPLYDRDEDNFAALPSKRRNMIRRGQRSELECRVDRADLAAFYDLHARTMRHFGTPVFPARFFRSLLEQLPQESALVTVRRQGVPVAAALVFIFGGVVCPYYAGSRRDFFRYAVSDFMFWEVMRYGRQRGARIFDFGRSKKGTGAYEFKRLWGFEPEPLRYRRYQCDGGMIVERSAAGDGVHWLQRAWRHLPLPLTKLLGPFFLARYGAYYT